MTLRETHEEYRRILAEGKRRNKIHEYLAELERQDLFYLLRYGLGREDVDHPWVFERCREWQAAPDGYLDLWAREHYKSTIITFGGIVQGLFNDPERTYGILSYTRPAAKTFLRQIKVELETNEGLKSRHPDILWADPRKEAPKWSEDDGIVVKRKGNPKESSVEAWGLTDGQPTGRHFSDLHYEDIVTVDTARTPGMLAKTTDAFRTSLNLGTRGGRRRAVGTRWHYADTYGVIFAEGIMPVRIHPATKDGKLDGEPVLFSRELLQQKIKDMGPYIAACQLFLDPVQESLEGFKSEWLRYWRADRTTGLNLYILCDPASSKKAGSDYTVFVVVGLGSDRNYYIVNWIRDRLSLTEKANILFKWHQQYRPVQIGYEQYGMQADIAHYQDRMQRDNYRFGIMPLAGKLGKPERIGRLVAPFSASRVYIPESSPHQQYDGVVVDQTKVFINDEYLAHPFEAHDDMLDCLARILDPELGAVFPQGKETDPLNLERPADEAYDPLTWGLKTEGR
jgi:phage terminase large subunit-like protein